MKDINLKAVGFDIQLGGMILVDKDTMYLVSFPDENKYELNKKIVMLNPTVQEFDKLVRQMDLQEIELYDTDKRKKMLVRKTQRSMDSIIMWHVYERDNFTCRHCGTTGLPMTYDHVKLWERGGENSIENGLCSCRKCNKTRGSIEYSDWIQSKYYIKRSSGLTQHVKELNLQLAQDYINFPTRKSSRTR